jgi:hypothetical protein
VSLWFSPLFPKTLYPLKPIPGFCLSSGFLKQTRVAILSDFDKIFNMKDGKRIVFLLSITVLLLAAACEKSSETSATKEKSSPPPPAPSYNPIFQPIIDNLKRETKVPVQLPAKIPDVGQGEAPLFAVQEEIEANNYSIIIGLTPDCNGDAACRIGTVKARAIRSRRGPRLKGQVVRLTPDITGYFIEAKCRANCPDSTITWKQDKTLYTLGLKSGRLNALIEMARSTIGNEIK